MFRSLMIAGAVALGAFGMTGAAEARTSVGIYFGVPFYDHQVGPGWRYDDGYGWYDYNRWGDFHRHHRHDRLNCREARRIVDRRFDRVRVVECNGRTYTFRAENRRGRMVTVYVNSRTGDVWR